MIIKVFIITEEKKSFDDNWRNTLKWPTIGVFTLIAKQHFADTTLYNTRKLILECMLIYFPLASGVLFDFLLHGKYIA